MIASVSLCVFGISLAHQDCLLKLYIFPFLYNSMNLNDCYLLQFFSLFRKYLESICMCLYDKLRPMVIHMNYLETLAELCSILRVEILQEHVHNNRKLFQIKYLL